MWLVQCYILFFYMYVVQLGYLPNADSLRDSVAVDMVGGAKNSSESTTGSRKSARIRQRTKQKEAKATAEETGAESDAQVG